MTIVSAKKMLVKASEEKYAVGAFNITSVVQMVAVIEAAAEKNAPVIVQTSVTPANFLTPEVVVAVFRALAQKVSIPFCVPLDHCTDVDFCNILLRFINISVKNGDLHVYTGCRTIILVHRDVSFIEISLVEIVTCI